MPPSERPEQYDLGKLPVPQSSVTCSLCDQILHQPLQLGCGAILCSSCTLSWIENSHGLFRNCHLTYNKNIMTEHQTSYNSYQHFHSYTGGFIKEFMEYYRKTFPHATVLPKMHFLESHLVEWL
jgi:hypothetical protein